GTGRPGLAWEPPALRVWPSLEPSGCIRVRLGHAESSSLRCSSLTQFFGTRTPMQLACVGPCVPEVRATPLRVPYHARDRQPANRVSTPDMSQWRTPGEAAR